MKILIASGQLPPNGGGAEIAAVRQAEMLREAGSDVVLVSAAKKSESRFSVSSEDGTRVYRYRPWNVGTIFELRDFSFPRRLLWHLVDACNFRSALFFRHVLRQEKPDVVLFHNIKGLGYLLPRAAKRLGFKTVLVLHDVQLIEPSGIAEPEVRAVPLRVFWSMVTRVLVGSPDLVLFPSDWLLRLSERWGFFPASERRVLRNPIDEHSTEEARPIRTFLFLGQLEPHKGILILLEAFRRIEGDARLIFVGEGSLRRMLRDAGANDARIQARGRLDGAALASAWSETDCVVLPSICAENAPMVIREASARGIPVIASKVGGVPEFLEEEWLVPHGDAEALRRCMQNLLGTVVSRDARAAMIAKGAAEDETYRKELLSVLQGV